MNHTLLSLLIACMLSAIEIRPSMTPQPDFHLDSIKEAIEEENRLALHFQLSRLQKVELPRKINQLQAYLGEKKSVDEETIMQLAAAFDATPLLNDYPSFLRAILPAQLHQAVYGSSTSPAKDLALLKHYYAKPNTYESLQQITEKVVTTYTKKSLAEAHLSECLPLL
jgi:hypothetical protein